MQCTIWTDTQKKGKSKLRDIILFYGLESPALCLMFVERVGFRCFGGALHANGSIREEVSSHVREHGRVLLFVSNTEARHWVDGTKRSGGSAGDEGGRREGRGRGRRRGHEGAVRFFLLVVSVGVHLFDSLLAITWAEVSWNLGELGHGFEVVQVFLEHAEQTVSCKRLG